jgi:hypothetical protein
MTSLRFVACEGLMTIDVEIDTENFLEIPKATRETIFLVVDDLREMFDDFVDPAVKAPRKKRVPASAKTVGAVREAKKQTPPRAPEVDRPKIGDTRPAPAPADPRQITKRLKGDGKIRWEEHIARLVDGTCDRIVREVSDEKAGKNLKYFIQNKDRRVRVDVVTIEGVTVVEVRRRESGE